MKRHITFKYLTIAFFLFGCEKEGGNHTWMVSDYEGSYKNIVYSESLIKDFAPGTYPENEIPDELKQLEYGRMEIDFKYNGGALKSFMPILYYGSINKNGEDNAFEETQFHLVVEIGHYNVVPFPIENLFYTICYDRYPLYCRDTYIPVIAGENYTFVLDKRPEGIIIQLKKGGEIVNSFPSAFFPDSSQLFFKDVTNRVEKARGDSLEVIMMIGQGFVGFEGGLHEFNGEIAGIKMYKYTITDLFNGYEIAHVKNQHYENQQVSYIVKDNLSGNGHLMNMAYDFQPFKYKNGSLVPYGDVQHVEKKNLQQNTTLTYNITSENIGLYKVFFETLNQDNEILNRTKQPFEIWVYPEDWKFDY